MIIVCNAVKVFAVITCDGKVHEVPEEKKAKRKSKARRKKKK